MRPVQKRSAERKDEMDRSIYAVTRGNDTKKCVRDAIDALGGIGKFVKNGDKVLVKVNICGGVPEIKGSYTSTVVADELVDLIRSAGGEPIFADADMIWTKFWQAAKDSGWVDWAKKKGVRLLNLSETKIVNFDFGKESVLGIEKVSMEMHRCRCDNLRPDHEDPSSHRSHSGHEEYVRHLPGCGQGQVPPQRHRAHHLSR